MPDRDTAAPVAPDAVIEISSDEVRHRAAGGAVIVGLRGIAIRIVGLVGNIILARLLLPEDFGLIAFAASVTFFASAVGDAGLGAGLIRRKEPPTLLELRSVAGFQLLASGGFAMFVAVIAWPLGRPGIVAAVMVASLPLIAFRTPGAILLERQLKYRPLVVIEFAETLAFNLFAIATVALGAGVWGMASAASFRSLVGALSMIAVSPAGLVMPRFDLKPLRSLVAFGAQFQVVGFVLVAKGLVLNAGIATFGGLRILGVWAIAERFLSVLTLVMESLWRVSFPMMSRLIDAGEDVPALVARNVALVTFAIGLMGSVLVGAGPALVPMLLGNAYSTAVVVLPPACLGAVLLVPVGVVVGGYLYADGRAGAVLVPVIVQSLVLYGVTFPLLSRIGVVAVGIGTLTSGLVGAVLMVRAAKEIDAAAIVRASCRPVLASVLAGAAGVGAAKLTDYGVVSILAGGAGAAVVYLAVMVVLDKSLVYRVRGFVTLAAREATGSSARRAAASI